MAVEQWRNGELITTLVDDQDYSYDSPAIYKYVFIVFLPFSLFSLITSQSFIMD